MLKRNREKGITLIALVVTIIVLLILAAISLSMLTGENGILTNAKSAKENTTKGQLEEELQMAINEIQLEKTMKGEPLTKKDIAEYLSSSKGVVIIDYTDDIIDGEHENYQIVIDKNNKVTVGGKMTGAKPIPTITPLDTAEGIESARIQVTATTTEGEIASIESMDGLTPTAENGNADKTFTVTSNGEYKFKIIGTNGRISIGKITMSNLEEIIEAESLLKAIDEITGNKEQIKVRVTGVTSDGSQSTETYSLHVIYYDDDLTLGSDSSVGKTNALTLDGTTWTCGSLNDIATGTEENQMAKNTVVLKVNGNLTIENGYKLTAIGGTYGGPKGMIVYSSETLTNNGEISMTERGAYAKEQNVYWYKKKDESFLYVPAIGGNVTNPLATGSGSNSARNSYFGTIGEGMNGTGFSGGSGRY